jgi:hypothetical protein
MFSFVNLPFVAGMSDNMNLAVGKERNFLQSGNT